MGPVVTSLAPVSALRGLHQRQRQLQRLNLFFLLGLPLLVLTLGWDFFHFSNSILRPVEPISPGLTQLRESPLPIPELNLTESLFLSPKPALKETPAVSVSRTHWKLKGVLMGATRRALLKDTEGKEEDLWVTEGQQVGSSKVTRIQEGSVTLDAGGEIHEIRM